MKLSASKTLTTARTLWYYCNQYSVDACLMWACLNIL